MEATILFITDKRIEGNDPVSRGFEKLLERRKIVIKMYEKNFTIVDCTSICNIFLAESSRRRLRAYAERAGAQLGCLTPLKNGSMRMFVAFVVYSSGSAMV